MGNKHPYILILSLQIAREFLVLCLISFAMAILLLMVSLVSQGKNRKNLNIEIGKPLCSPLKNYSSIKCSWILMLFWFQKLISNQVLNATIYIFPRNLSFLGFPRFARIPNSQWHSLRDSDFLRNEANMTSMFLAFIKRSLLHFQNDKTDYH